MTDNNHTEGISQEVARLFKKAHRIERLGAEDIFYGSTRGDDFKRDRLKDIISGKYGRRQKASDALDKLSENLSQLEMFGDLLSMADETIGGDSIITAGNAIWRLAHDASEARTILSDRHTYLENGGAS